jgi:contractile injection system tube protein/LysM domain-containing protein
MPDVTNLAKAELHELDANFQNEINRENWTTVQFNPETLKVSFSNQVVVPSGGGDQKGTPGMQFVGAGSTKLSVQLWFDITVPTPPAAASASFSAGPLQASVGVGQVDDVRKLTQKVAYFITPKQAQDDQNKFIPPGVRFIWGSFQFDGLMDSLEESLEFFSSEGKPLRASVSFSLSQQKIQKFVFRGSPFGGIPGLGAAGTNPLVRAAAGATLQGIADNLGKGGNWQAIASANGIENPRSLQPGQLVNTNVNTSS